MLLALRGHISLHIFMLLATAASHHYSPDAARKAGDDASKRQNQRTQQTSKPKQLVLLSTAGQIQARVCLKRQNVWLFTCMHIHIYIYIYTYTHIHVVGRCDKQQNP